MKFKKGDIIISNGKGVQGKKPVMGCVYIVSSIDLPYRWWEDDNTSSISVRKYNLDAKKYYIDSYIFSENCFKLYYNNVELYKFLLRKKI